MPKHPFAIYYDSHGNKKKINPSDLHDTQTRAEARNAELWDSEEEYRLFPRYRADAPHFYSLSSRLRELHVPVEADPAHQQRIDELFGNLTSGANYRIGYYSWDGPEEPFVVITRTH